jgi:DNA gyrase/topoisomerase IV subunit B
VNALSTEMTATVHRDGFEWFQKFRQGKPVGTLQKVKPFRGRGTTIFFRPDESIFRKTTFDTALIKERLEDISYVQGGLSITYNDEAHKEQIQYHHPDGLVGYLQKLITEGGKKPVADQVFSAAREEDSGKIEVVLRWTESAPMPGGPMRRACGPPSSRP